MNSTRAQFLNRRLPKGAARLCRLISATMCLFLLTAVPVLADPISVSQVVQTLSSSQATIDLRLKTLIAQDPAMPKGTQGGPRAEGTQPQGGTKTESIISGVAVTSEGQKLGIEYIEEGVVDGSICDCGIIPVPLVAAGFPKWSFLFLAAVPLVFIDHHNCDNCDEVNAPTPQPHSIDTPTPPPPAVPEPASLLLFGTGLAAAGAGVRRRYAKTKTKEEE